MIDCSVLVTNAGTATATAIIRSLKGNVKELFAVDMSGFCYANHILKENFLEVPPFVEREEYKQALLDTCRKNKIKYIIPCSNDEELVFFAERKNEFRENGINIIASSIDAVNICDDKYKTIEYITKLGLRVPLSYLPPDIPENVKFPLIIKSRYGNGSEYMHKINSTPELIFLKERVPEAIIQELVGGNEYTLDTISDLNGKVIACVCRERVSVKSGIAVKAQIEDKKDYIDKTKTILESLKIIGPCNTQIINEHFIEINPRFSGGLGLSIASGINLPLLCIKVFEGLPISNDELQFKKNVKILRYWEEVIIHYEQDG